MKSTAVIHRPHYINRVIPYIGKKLIKVFSGQRRVGKSYLLFQLMDYLRKEDLDAHIIYINMEDLQFSQLRRADDLNRYVQEKANQSKMNYLFIDEVQEIEDFELVLRSLLLNDQMDIYCTGSNADLLSKDIAGKLSGRFIEINVYSLSYTEFLNFHQLENSDKSLSFYMKYGGLPYLKHLDFEDEIVFEYLKNIYSTIIYRDIVNRYALRNSDFLEQLITFLASNIGSLFSAKKISDFLKSQHLKVSPNQVQTYLSHIVNAFIVHRLRRYDLKGKRLFEVGDKFYFENMGIRNGIWGYRQEDEGKIMENMVYNHLLFLGADVHVGVFNQYEIDFVAEKNNERKYFQVALSLKEEKTIKREFGNLLKIKDQYPKAVITMDGFSGNTHYGIPNVSLRSFLSNDKWEE